jgi:hypothetical protein
MLSSVLKRQFFSHLCKGRVVRLAVHTPWFAVEFLGCVTGVHVDVSMRDVKTLDPHAGLGCTGYFFHTPGYPFDNSEEGSIGLVVQILKAGYLDFWHHQYMAGLYGVDVQKGDGFIVLINLFGWNLPLDNFGKNTVFHALIVPRCFSYALDLSPQTAY